jgi:protein-S-isoprenylcysteine O-methyltransferase Ste14
LGAIVFFVARPLGALSLVHTHWSAPWILLWDAVLSMVFFLQHSGMNRQGFRARLSRWIAPRYHGAVYSIASGVALLLVLAAWQTTSPSIVVLQGLGRVVAQVVSALAFGLFVVSATSLLTFDPLGLRPITAHLQNRPFIPSPFLVRGPYRWVRHPLYSCTIVMIWTEPNVTTDRLLFNILWTVWIVVGTYLEERDLSREFGDSYRDYQRRVPMLVP